MGMADCKGDDDQQGESAVLGDGRQADDGRPQPDPHDIDDGGEDDAARREIVGELGIKSGVIAEGAQTVGAKDRRNRTQGGGPDQGELRPAEEKGRRAAPPLAQIGIEPPGLRQGARQLRDRKRAAEGYGAAKHPDQEHQGGIGHPRGDDRRIAEYAGADRDADDHSDRRPDAEPALKPARRLHSAL